MTTKYSIRCRGEGRGKGSVQKFKTLADAAKYIQDRWQGAEYMDGKESFHTDYSTYELSGFTLADVGVIGWDNESGFRTFKFHLLATLRGEKPDKPRIVGCYDSERDAHHFRATEDYIAEKQAEDVLCMGPWTDAEYRELFGRDYVSETAEDLPAMSTAEAHAQHSEPRGWCPLCNRVEAVAASEPFNVF